MADVGQPQKKPHISAAPALVQATEGKENARPVVPRGMAEPESNTPSTDYGNMQGVIDYLESQKAAIHMPTKEELEKERRRQKTEGIISAVADGARAISNLVTTTQYAPNMYHPEGSMSARTKARFEKLKSDRQADADQYYNYAMAIGRLKDAQDDKDYKRGRDALQDHLAEIKADNAARLSDIRYKRLSQQISAAQAAAEEREANAELNRQIKEARLEEIQSRRDRNNRWRPSGGSSGRPAEHAWRDQDGNLHYCHSESAARSQAAANGGTYVTTPTRRRTNTTTSLTGRSTEVETDVSTPQETIDWDE